MKITHRVIADEVMGANLGPLRDSPYGFRVHEPTGNPAVYRLDLVSRKSGAPASTLCCGSPREIMAAMKAVLLVLPLVRGTSGSARGVISDCWSFIEDVTDDDPQRSEKFFALRARVRVWFSQNEAGS